MTTSVTQMIRSFQFCAALQTKLGNFFKVVPQTGNRYIKVIVRNNKIATVFCYLDTTNGDIHRAVGPKGVMGPDQVRGNINQLDFDLNLFTHKGIPPLKRGRKAVKVITTSAPILVKRNVNKAQKVSASTYHGTW